MSFFHVPAVCPTCGAVFSSGIVVAEGGSATFDGVGAGPCPNGHQGVVLDGTYTAIDKLKEYLQSAEGRPKIEEIVRVARRVGQKTVSAEDGLEEVADLLPKDLGTAVKKLGSKNPVTAFLIVLAVIGSLVTSVSGLATIYKTLSPNAPTAPTIIINNNPTNINTATARDDGNQTIPHSANRHERRRMEKLEAKKKHLPKASEAKTKKECQPGIDPTNPHGCHS